MTHFQVSEISPLRQTLLLPPFLLLLKHLGRGVGVIWMSHMEFPHHFLETREAMLSVLYKDSPVRDLQTKILVLYFEPSLPSYFLQSPLRCLGAILRMINIMLYLLEPFVRYLNSFQNTNVIAISVWL